MLASEKYLDYLQKNHKEAGQVKLLVSSDVKALRSSSVLSVRDLGLTPSLVGKVSDVTLTKKKALRKPQERMEEQRPCTEFRVYSLATSSI